MRCPTLDELPPAPTGKIGWPWTEGSRTKRQSGPKVTIVTPSYNQAEFIEETIRSILLQGYPDLEYFVIDGGSSDDTVSVIEKYQPWLSGWVSEADRGQSHALNKGFARARGEIVGWLNSDDFYYPGAVAQAVDHLIEHPGVVAVFGQLRVVDAESRVLWTEPARRFRLERYLLFDSLAQQSAFIRTAALRSAGPVDESLHCVMDYELWLRLSRQGELDVRRRVWGALRRHAAAKTSTIAPLLQWAELLRVTHGLLDDPAWAAHREAITSAIGYAHWFASVVCWNHGDPGQARAHVAEAAARCPQAPATVLFLRRLFALLWPDGPQDDFERVRRYLDLVPDALSSKRPALRRAQAYLEMLVAYEAGQPLARRIGHVGRALQASPSFSVRLGLGRWDAIGRMITKEWTRRPSVSV